MAVEVAEKAAEDKNVKILAQNITKIFWTRKENSRAIEKYVAVKNINLRVKESEFLTLVGPSGCGKSTILDILAGLTSPSSGKILVDGKETVGPSLNRGIVMQGYALFPWLTVRKNVEFGLLVQHIPEKKRHEISSHFLELVNLTGFENRYPYELSGGMKQRVAIARTLAYNPDILLMDEPFAALDAQTREALQDELLRIWTETKKTIIFVTHSIDEAIYLADRVAVFSDRPGEIKQIVPINLRRPRSGTRSTIEYRMIYDKVSNLLHETKSANTPLSKGSQQDVASVISESAVL